MKLKIKLTNKDKNIPINLNGINNILGYDDSIGLATEKETESRINPVTDLEVIRFTPQIETSILFRFFYWNGSSYQLELAPLDFQANSLTRTSQEVKNSFYVIQIFDSFNEAIQNKLHTGYFNGYDFLSRSTLLNSIYSIDKKTEFLDLYISRDFILEKNTENIDVYFKTLFYSGKSSKFYPFSKVQNTSNLEDVYYKITLNINNYTYGVSSVFNFYEIVNPQYSNLITETVPSIPVEKTIFPTGNTFTQDGEYVII